MKNNSTNDRNPIRPLLAQASDALPVNGYKTTPASRNGSGYHDGGKPTDPAAQWMLQPSGKLPWRAFEVHPKERERFWKLSHSVPLNGNEMAEVQRIGGEIFDASLAAPATRFEAEVAAGQLEVNRLHAERARVERDIEVTGADLADIPATEQKEQAEPRLPQLFSAKGAAFLMCVFLLILSSAAAVFQIGNLYLPTMQSWRFAAIAASPWVLAAIAVEIFCLLTIRADSVKVARAWCAAVIVLLIGVGLWIVGLLPLAAPIDLNATTILVPDRRLAVAGQLLSELACSFLLLTAILKLTTLKRLIVPNENRYVVSAHISELSRQLARINREIGSVLTELSNAQGNLREWQNSRAAFIEEGICIVHLRVPDAALLAELQRQRGEKQKLLTQFSA